MGNLFHLRIKNPRAYSRQGYSAAHFQRVTGTYPVAKTVCGADPTDIDVASKRDLVDWISGTRGQMIPCAKCQEAKS